MNNNPFYNAGEEYLKLKTSKKTIKRGSDKTYSSPNYKAKPNAEFQPETIEVKYHGQALLCISQKDLSRWCNAKPDTFHKWMKRNKIGTNSCLQIPKKVFGNDSCKIIYSTRYARKFIKLYAIANIQKGKEIEPEIKTLFKTLDTMEQRELNNARELPNYPMYRDLKRNIEKVKELCS
jgi:hypothetical protein